MTRKDSTPVDDGLPGPIDVTVKEVVLSVDEAKREVERLNRLNESKGCRYYWQSTRVFLDGGSFGSEGTTGELANTACNRRRRVKSFAAAAAEAGRWLLRARSPGHLS